MSIGLKNKIVNLLAEHPDRKFNGGQLAKMFYDKHPEECERKIENSRVITTKKELLAQLSTEIGGRERPYIERHSSQIKIEKPKGSPWQFWWASGAEQDEADESETAKTGAQPASENSSFDEHDLYPKICEYLSRAHGIYPKRIDEKKSSNTRGPKGNRWLYPDIVGMEDLTAEWTTEIKRAVKEYSGKETKLWSFEVKKTLTISSVRPAYFQAVSNSSWANFGYLATTDIADAQTEKELQMLSALHGIGVIKIDRENPSNSQIIIPAREKPEIDWATCNRLMVNKDFVDFIESIRKFHQTGDPDSKSWDLPEDWDSDD